jgi:hypothetical protein
MRKSFYLLIVCGIFVVCLFPSCKKDVKVSGIIVEPKNLYLSKGDVAQLSYMVTPYGADDKSVKWTSNDISVATVSETGFVTAISEGETQIIATTNDGHFTDKVSVTVLRGSPAGDSIALVKLYEIAENLPYWDLTKPMNTWQGVVLNSNRRVVSISDDRIYINDPLDVSIGNLACLKRLDLGTSYYTNAVTILAEIGKLTDLQHLSLRGGFTGTIPPESGNLTNLKKLIVCGNHSLTGDIPRELGNLINLEILYLADNQLTGEIPRELENLINLQELNLSYNSLSGNIPQALLERLNWWWWSFCPQNGTNFDNLDCSGY